MKKTIKICGKKIEVAFNMKTQMAYEDLSGERFDMTKIPNSTKGMVQLYMACMLSADSEAKVDDLLENANYQDIQALDKAIAGMMADFYKMPATATKPSPKSAQEEGEEEGNPSQPTSSGN